MLAPPLQQAGKFLLDELEIGQRLGHPGPATASPLLGSPFGLALRLQRATLIWWSVSLFILGLIYGGVAQEAGQLYEDVDAIQKYLARLGEAQAANQYLALTLSISALIAVAYALQSALRQRSEETALRVEPLLATPVSRGRFAASHLAMALGGSLVLLFAIGLGTGTTRAISAGDAAELPRLIGASLAYAPALWVFAGAAFALYGLIPRATGAVWGALGGFAFIGMFGPLLQLPDWVYQLSPLEHVPRMPVAGFTPAPLIVLTAIAAGFVAAGLVGFRRRDIAAA